MERSSCLAVKFFTAVTLALSYRDQAEGFATLTKSGALPPLHACVSSKQSNVLSRKARAEGECFVWLPPCLSLQQRDCKRRSQRKSQQRSSHWQYLSDLKQAHFGTLKWHEHRVVFRSVGQECGLLYLTCLELWCAEPWTSCSSLPCQSKYILATQYVWMSQLCPQGSNLGSQSRR